jgi:CelD/BcsL family acetyltransferase involved in cellulose biosynthesis
MNVETIDTSQDFFALCDEWNTLLKSSESNCVFLTHEWLSAWWKHLADGRRLAILTARDGDELIGLLPVAERPAQLARMMPRVLEFLGSGMIGSDYLDVIAQKGRESEVMAAFAQTLTSRGLMLQLSQLRGADCAASLLAEQLRQQTWTVTETKLNVCPFIDLRRYTWESYLATLGPNVRKNINRYLRNLPRTFDMRIECVQYPAGAPSALDTAIDLHHKRWNTAGTSEAFQSAPVIAFHRDFVSRAAERGWLRLLILWLDGNPAASLYGLRYGPTFYFYQSGFDPAYGKHSVGVATMGLAIKTAIEEGAAEYDFLHGDEEYKFHWAKETRELKRLELHPPQTSSWIYKHAIHLNRAARQMARRVLHRAGNNAALCR